MGTRENYIMVEPKAFAPDLKRCLLFIFFFGSIVIFYCYQTTDLTRMIEISDFNDLEKMNLEHTDLENCEHIAETSLFRNRPAPIVSEYKKKNDEQIDVQQTIHDAEMETEQIIERTTTETSNVTKPVELIENKKNNESEILSVIEPQADKKLEEPLPLCEPKKLVGKVAVPSIPKPDLDETLGLECELEKFHDSGYEPSNCEVPFGRKVAIVIPYRDDGSNIRLNQ